MTMKTIITMRMYFNSNNNAILRHLIMLSLALILPCISSQRIQDETQSTTEWDHLPLAVYEQTVPEMSKNFATPNRPLLDEDSTASTQLPYSWTSEEYPNPLTQPIFCRNRFPSHICDPNDILPAEEKTQLTKSIQALTELQCYCDECPDTKGIAVGIALMEGMYKQYMVHPSNNTINFAQQLRQKWNLGNCDNDILILLAVHDREWYPALGATTEKLIPKEQLDKIRNQTKAAFHTGQFHQGLELFLQGIKSTLSNSKITLGQRNEISQEAEKSILEPEGSDNSDLKFILGFSFLAFLTLSTFCLVLYMLLSWHRRREQTKSTHGDIEKRAPVATGEDEEDEDVIVYDRQSSSGDEDKKSPLTWSAFRDKISGHRSAPATEAEKAVLNQEKHTQHPSSLRTESLVKSSSPGATIITGTDDEIEPIDIETMNHADQVDTSCAYRETTIEN